MARTVEVPFEQRSERNEFRSEAEERLTLNPKNPGLKRQLLAPWFLDPSQKLSARSKLMRLTI